LHNPKNAIENYKKALEARKWNENKDDEA